MLNIILQEAKEVRAKYPKGLNQGRCLCASSELVERLRNKNIQCCIQFGIFNNQKHAWVDVWTSEGVKLLDVTADQWGDNVPEIIFDKMINYPQYGWEE